MSDEIKKPNEPGTMFTHLPLPYVVTARVIVSDDAPPAEHVIHLTAYSMFEAMFQASISLGGTGGLEDAKVKVEKIEPDVPEYQRVFIGYLALAVLRTTH